MIVRQVVVCAACGLHWPVGAEPACDEPEHTHHRMDIHLHCDDVVLPDGTVVTASSWPPAEDPYRRDRVPDFGLYLDPRWAPPWPHQHVAWPDFGVPTGRAQLHEALTRLRSRARDGDRVEIGCLGGHGRTGTALACLAVLTGLSADQATAWVRAHYCSAAVETEEQQTFVSDFAAAVERDG